MSRENIPEQIKADVFETFGFETGVGNCWCCGHGPLRRSDVFMGHIIAHKFGGPSTFDNLRPICRNCNLLGDKTENAYERKLRINDGMEFIDDEMPYKGMTRREFLTFINENIRLPPIYTYNGSVKAIIEYCGQYRNFKARDLVYSDFQVTGYIAQSAISILQHIYEEQEHEKKKFQQDVSERLAGMSIC